ncbi:unnamed protein product [Durusdinium trenchii]|uniref:Uncharacterized protein n=1 Tax=Durusdinium trenchii TaxID=1381693 RepID=A0ABP0ICY1_9DINO
MTEEQLQIFWSQFKLLEKDGPIYDKPPCNWQPPRVVDMNSEQLEAYWNAFRKIMSDAADKLPDAEDLQSSADEDETGPAVHQVVPADSGDEPAADVVVLESGEGHHGNPRIRRCREKTSMADAILTQSVVLSETADPSVKHPEKHMLNKQRRAGQYQGCFAKWQKRRVSHKWDLFCEIAPKQAKICTEIPNSVKVLLGVSELKHANSKFKNEDGARQVPVHLALAVESILMERIHMGEEVTMDFAAEVLLAMVNTWNSKISELSDEIRERCGQQFLQQQDSMIDTEAAGPDADRLDEQATKQLDHLLEFLRSDSLAQKLNQELRGDPRAEQRAMVEVEVEHDNILGEDLNPNDGECQGDMIQECVMDHQDMDGFAEADDEQLCKDMADWMLVHESESEDEDLAVNAPAHSSVRMPAVEMRPEYIRLKNAGLHLRPAGCTLGVHPSACVWRSSTPTSVHFSRSFTETSGRTSWQALLIVMELLLSSHVEANPNDRMSKQQLSRVRRARGAEPAHKD